MIKFGKKFEIQLEEKENVIELKIKGVPEGIKITAIDFGRDLSKRKMEGFSPDPEEEIDVISGIENETTNGKEIIFRYYRGNKLDAIILAGTIAKKILKTPIVARATEIGGISVGEKNEAYIRVAVQKVIMTKDSLGSALEIDLSEDIDVDKFKPDFSGILFKLISDAEAVQFGLGIKSGKKASTNFGIYPKKVEVTFAPDRNRIIPAIAAVYDIAVESIAAITILNI